MSAAWAIDMNSFLADVQSRLIEWGKRTAVRTGFDEGRFIFVRKKNTTRQALYHNLRSLARNWGVELPEGQEEWLREADVIKAKEVGKTVALPPKEAPITVEKQAPYIDDVYKSLLAPDFAEQVRRMINASA